MKIEVNASYTNGKSNAPDFKIIQFQGKGLGTSEIVIDLPIILLTGISGILQINFLIAGYPPNCHLGNNHALTRKLKFGGAYQNSYQKSDQYNII